MMSRSFFRVQDYGLSFQGSGEKKEFLSFWAGPFLTYFYIIRVSFQLILTLIFLRLISLFGW